MDATHIHLILTHFPIIGLTIGFGILVYGQYSKNNTIKKVALIIFILMAILTIPAYLSGEEAEEKVENIAGVSESIIEDHEELAEKAIWLMGLLGAFSLLNLYAISKNLTPSKTISTITIVISIATLGLFAKVGNLGGQIRHSEIRTQNPTSKEKLSKGILKKRELEEEDDDDD
jgi:uncharacterized membrane protein